ncbi:endoribonuclease Dicer isoform X3 [Hydra vulgaris]|uniref:Endoribonuclease Dicer isoform X3 n=1 Tax=Hydra vulgaris TaxID=6087 RepID=A0ABM4CGA2_HYDVU
MQQTSVEEFLARPYQIELLDLAKKSNTILCLGTGTGKTFISVMLIKEKQHEIKRDFKNRGKRTFFLVCTVPLAYQQSKVISDNTALKVGCYTGDMGVDFWDKNKWIAEFNKNDVFVMTAQILVNILNHSIICLYNINLIIMDECHNATKNHSYVKLMEIFEKYPKSEHPHILGLTASIINEKYTGIFNRQSIKSFLQDRILGLERRMRSKCITCSDPQATTKFAAKPSEIVQTFKKGYSANGFLEFVPVIESMKKILDAMLDHFSRLANEKKTRVSRLIFDDLLTEKLQLSERNACAISVDAMKYCKEILESLGPLCVFWAAQILIKQIDNHIKRTRSNRVIKDVLTKCKESLNKVVKEFENEAVYVFSSIENVIPVEPLLTTKAASFLRDVLLAEKNYFQELHAIVFTQRRCTAVVLSKLINYQIEKDETYKGLNSDFVLGHAFDSNICLIDGSMKSKKQNLILSNFKQDKFNVLVSTSVVEEGLDVRKCNLVVRFDGINNYREYAQSKGRARASGSKFIIMTEEEQEFDTKKQHIVMQQIEEILFEQCQNRVLPTDEEIEIEMMDVEDEDFPIYFSHDGYDAPRITKDNAISLLYRYCSRLPSDQFCKTNPKFLYHVLENQFCAECMLPLNCPLPQRIYKGEQKSTKDLAKKSVCMIICQALHKFGELNTEHLLPMQHSDDSASDSDSIIEQKSINQLFSRKNPKEMLSNKIFCFDDFDLYAVCISLSEPSKREDTIPLQKFWHQRVRSGFGLFMPKNISKLPSFDLFSRVGKLNIELIKITSRIRSECDINIDDVIDFHMNVITESCSNLVDGEIYFHINDENVTKALFVPLHSDVFKAVRKTRYEFIFPVIDKRLLNCTKIKTKDNLDDEEIFENCVVSKNYGESKNRIYYVTAISSLNTSSFMEGKKTFVQYYLKKYNIEISPNKPLVDVISCSQQISFTNSESNTNTKKKNVNMEKLVPELCKKVSLFPADLHFQLPCLPRILYFYEYYFLALELKDMIAEKIKINKSENQGRYQSSVLNLEDLLQLKNHVTENVKSPSVLKIFEALTTRQARMPFDLERLEVLGDSFLKQAVSIFVYFQNPSFHEGKLTIKRKNCISNENLCKVGKSVGIQNLICNSQFGTKSSISENRNPWTVWLPPGYLRAELDDIKQYTYQNVKPKSIADCVEALIGVYFEVGGVNLALCFMQNFLNIPVLHSSLQNGRKVMKPSHYADYPCVSRSANIAFNNEQVLYEHNLLHKFEDQISYRFLNKSHLIQAFTHLSYLSNSVTGCYQQYEFLGDAILDFLITLHIQSNTQNLSPGQLTYFRSAVVNNNTFGLLAIKHSFYKYIYSSSNELFSSYNSFIEIVKDDQGLKEEYFESPFVICPTGSEEGYQAPKVLGDLFESVAGAIFLDSGLNLVTVWKIYYPLLKPVIDKYMIKLPRHPAVDLFEKYPEAKINYTGGEVASCTVKFGKDNGTEIKACGQNKKIAKAAACKRALEV